MRQKFILRYVWAMVLFMGFQTISGQHLDSVKVVTQINTVNRSYLEVQLDLRLAGNKLIDDSFDLGQPFELVSEFEGNRSTSEAVSQRMGFSRSKILLQFENLSSDFIGSMVEGRSKPYVEFKQDLFIPIFDTLHKQVTPFVISRAKIRELTLNRIRLSQDQSQALIESLGGAFAISQNKLDFGYNPKEQSTTDRAEFYFTFDYRTGYNFISEKNLFFYTEGQIGTNSRDSLNYFYIYPINYKLFDRKSEVIAQLGIEGNQRFTNYRIAGNAYWQGLLPNLVDLSFNHNRLRLKPILKLGTRFYQEIDNMRPEPDDEKIFSNQVFGEVFYYIPVMKIYSITIELGAFYDFSDKVADGDLKSNYRITFGLEIPKTDFKTIFSYQDGANDINYENARLLLIGLTADLFGGQIGQ